MTSGHDVTPITMALMAGFQHSRAAQCLSSMLSRFFVVENFNKISNILFRDALNPADIVQLHKLYNASDPPPVELIRFPIEMEKASEEEKRKVLLVKRSEKNTRVELITYYNL